MDSLFETPPSEPWPERLGPGAVLLRGFARANTHCWASSGSI
ncbi:MAG: hypothetical protein U1F70_10370 [Candidatus Competibacteraceae bacterium]